MPRKNFSHPQHFSNDTIPMLFSMNIISVIQFVLKVFCSFSLSTVVMAKFMSSICVDLGAHSFFPTPHPFKIYLCLVTMAYGCATFARRVMKYTTPDK